MFLRLARLEVRGRAVLGLVVIALLAGVVLTLRVAAASRAAEPTDVGPSIRSPVVGRSVPPAFTGRASPAEPGDGSGPATPVGSATSGVVPQVVVHVVGQVAHPGVVRLPSGARVLDAVDRAGGALADADLRRINLARVLADGEQVFVPSPSDPAEPSGPSTVGSRASGSAGSSPAGSPTRVNLNTADLATLDSLPGVGPVLAQRILDWRTGHGRFTSIDELGEVSGIGTKLLAEIAPRVTL